MVGLVVSEQPVSVTPAAVSESDDPLPVATALRTNVVEFVMDAMVVPAAMFTPLMLMPGMSPVVLMQVTVVVPFVVQFANTIAERRLLIFPLRFQRKPLPRHEKTYSWSPTM